MHPPFRWPEPPSTARRSVVSDQRRPTAGGPSPAARERWHEERDTDHWPDEG